LAVLTQARFAVGRDPKGGAYKDPHVRSEVGGDGAGVGADTSATAEGSEQFAGLSDEVGIGPAFSGLATGGIGGATEEVQPLTIIPPITATTFHIRRIGRSPFSWCLLDEGDAG
jgi:hypothetical protein